MSSCPTSKWGATPKHVLTHPSLSDGARLLFAFLATECNPFKGRDRVRISNGNIAAALHWSRTKVKRCLVELLDAGLIFKAIRTLGEVVQYRLRWNERRETPAPVELDPPSPEASQGWAVGGPPPQPAGGPQFHTPHTNHPQTDRKRPKPAPAEPRGGVSLSLLVEELQPRFGAALDGTRGRPTVERAVVKAAGHRSIDGYKTTEAKKQAIVDFVSREVARWEAMAPTPSMAKPTTTVAEITRQLAAKEEERKRNAAPPPEGIKELFAMAKRNALRTAEAVAL